jgi:hypothetical protein
MDREEFLAAFGARLAPPGDGRDDRDRLEPEQLARSIVEQGRTSDTLDVLVSLLGGLA